jgi:hypothetical protein
MSSVLKGNYKTEKTVAAPAAVEEDAETRFEREATKRLGGSIAFVAKKKVVWDMPAPVDQPDTGKKD